LFISKIVSARKNFFARSALVIRLAFLPKSFDRAAASFCLNSLALVGSDNASVIERAGAT